MTRKKQLYAGNQWTDKNLNDWNTDKEPIYKSNNPNLSSNVKKVAKSYLNYNPTFYQNPKSPTSNTGLDRHSNFKSSQ